MNIRRPSTGSVTSKSISSRQGSWSSARAAWGTVMTAAARTTAMTAVHPLWGLRRLISSVSAMWLGP